MLAVKLKLIGKKGQHSFRVIVQEKRAKLDGNFVDDLGWYNPHSNQVKIDQKKLKQWLENGAQPTESAEKVIQKAKDSSDIQTYEGRPNSKKKKKDKKAAEAAEVAPAAPEAGGDEKSVEETAEPPVEEKPAESPAGEEEKLKGEEPKEEDLSAVAEKEEPKVEE